MISAVCQAGEPEPTARFTFGPGIQAAQKTRPTYSRRSAGRNQGLDNALARLERVHHRRRFYEIRTRAYDVKWVHSFSDQRETKLFDDNRGSGKNLERVGRSRHRRCDPGRAHRLLHPRLLEIHRRAISSTSMTNSL